MNEEEVKSQPKCVEEYGDCRCPLQQREGKEQGKEHVDPREVDEQIAGVQMDFGVVSLTQHEICLCSHVLDVHHLPLSSLSSPPQNHPEDPPPQTPLEAQGGSSEMVKSTLVVSSRTPRVLQAPMVSR